MRVAILALTCAALAAAPRAAAQTVLLASDASFLWSIDTQTFAVTPIGPMPMVNSSAEIWHGSLEFDEAGVLHSMTAQQFYTVDPATGQTTPIGPLDAGMFVFEGGIAFHPSGNAVFAANGGSNVDTHLLRIDKATGKATDLGNFPPGEHDFNGLEFDGAGQLYGLDRPTDALWRIDPANPGGPGTHMVGAGLGGGIVLGPGGGLTVDPSTGVWWGYAFSSHQLFTVDPATGVGTVVKTFDGTVPKFFALAAAGCGTVVKYGAGCAGSGGFVPSLDVLTCPVNVGQPISIAVGEALGGASALLVFGAAPGFAPMDAGCALLVQPLLAPVVALPLGGAGPGNGEVILGSVVPPGLPAPFTFTMQAFVNDAGGPAAFANSRGIEVRVDP